MMPPTPESEPSVVCNMSRARAHQTLLPPLLLLGVEFLGGGCSIIRHVRDPSKDCSLSNLGCFDGYADITKSKGGNGFPAV